MLNLNHLDMLLSLPCVIDEKLQFLDCAIIVSAKKSKNFNIYHHLIKENETICDFLKRIYEGADKYVMDCSTYAQLAAYVLSDRWPIGGGFISLIISYGVADGYILWQHKIPEMGYIGAVDPEIFDYLANSTTPHKGQWVIQTDTNKFLGLSHDKPSLLSMEEWVNNLRFGLIEWSAEKKYHHRGLNEPLKDILDRIETSMVRLYLERGQLNRWGLRIIKTTESEIIATWTPDGVFLKPKDNNKYSYMKFNEMYADFDGGEVPEFDTDGVRITGCPVFTSPDNDLELSSDNDLELFDRPKILLPVTGGRSIGLGARVSMMMTEPIMCHSNQSYFGRILPIERTFTNYHIGMHTGTVRAKAADPHWNRVMVIDMEAPYSEQKDTSSFTPLYEMKLFNKIPKQIRPTYEQMFEMCQIINKVAIENKIRINITLNNGELFIRINAYKYLKHKYGLNKLGMPLICNKVPSL